MSFKDKIFCGGKKNFFYIELEDFLELRNADNFWTDISPEEWLLRLEFCRVYYRANTKNKTKLGTHYRYTLSSELWHLDEQRFYLNRNNNRNQISFKECYPLSQKEWDRMQLLNKGSFCWHNPDYMGKLLNDIYTADISSAYLYYLSSKEYPYGFFEEIEDIEEIQETLNDEDFCWYGCFYFERLRQEGTFRINMETNRNDWIKRDSEEPNNYYVCLTDVDFYWFSKVFKWDNFPQISWFYCARKGRASKDVIKMCCERYREKEDFKQTYGKDAYQTKLAKQISPLVYGKSIQNKEYNTLLVYDEEKEDFVLQPQIKKTFEEVQSELKKRPVPYYAGLWISAYGRDRLFRTLEKMDLRQCLYCDTDSIFTFNSKSVGIFEEENKNIQKELRQIQSHYLSQRILIPEGLGEWKIEKIEIFKYLGNKTYYKKVEGKKPKITCSGIKEERLAQFFDLEKDSPDNFTRKFFEKNPLFYTIEQGKEPHSVCEKWSKMDKETKKSFWNKQEKV